jgi:hypothetical protein
MVGAENLPRPCELSWLLACCGPCVGQGRIYLGKGVGCYQPSRQCLEISSILWLTDGGHLVLRMPGGRGFREAFPPSARLATSKVVQPEGAAGFSHLCPAHQVFSKGRGIWANFAPVNNQAITLPAVGTSGKATISFS